jgi:zinc protease
LKAYQEQARHDLETSVKQNGYWLGALQGAFALGHDPLSILDRGKRLEALTGETVRATARAMFSSDRYTVVSLVPEPQAQ